MEITQIKVHLRNASNSKLKAFITITFDDMFVIRDLKVIEGKKGLFVAMPSLKRKEPCPSCGKRNPVRVRYCSECGSRLPEMKHHMTEEERREEHRDIAHPITPEARDYIQSKILNAYNEVNERGDQSDFSSEADIYQHETENEIKDEKSINIEDEPALGNEKEEIEETSEPFEELEEEKKEE